MKFQVRGVDSQSGENLVRVFEAPNGLAAERLAGEAGIFVESVTLLNDSPSAPPPQAPYTAPPASQSFLSPAQAMVPSTISYLPPPAFQGWPRHKTVSGLGVASLVLGIIGTVFFCFAPLSLTLAIVGLVLGVAGWIVAASSGGRTGTGMAIAGSIVSLLPFVIWAVLAMGFLHMMATAARTRSVPATAIPAPPPVVSSPPMLPEPMRINDRPNPAFRPHPAMDDRQTIIDRYGQPDAEDPMEDDFPRRPMIARSMTYKSEHVRVLLRANDLRASNVSPPHKAWTVTSYVDERTDAPLTRLEAQQRLAGRVKD